MKKTITLPLVLAVSLAAHAQTIVQTGFAFEPATLLVDAGQEITITLNAPHTATEVSEATWNANENTPNGGFNFSAGTHTLTLDVPGTYYYVCSPHAGMGMLTLIDAQGRVALRHTTTGADRVDISALAAGNYNATLSDATNKVIAREQVTIVR